MVWGVGFEVYMRLEEKRASGLLFRLSWDIGTNRDTINDGM